MAGHGFSLPDDKTGLRFNSSIFILLILYYACLMGTMPDEKDHHKEDCDIYQNYVKHQFLT